jgi:hypothetical protein
MGAYVRERLRSVAKDKRPAVYKNDWFLSEIYLEQVTLILGISLLNLAMPNRQ